MHEQGTFSARGSISIGTALVNVGDSDKMKTAAEAIETRLNCIFGIRIWFNE